MNLDPMLTPLAPYLSLIKTGLCITLLCGAFVTGCNHGESNKEEVVTQLTTQRDAAVEANKAWAEAGEESKRQLDANKQFAKEQYTAAEALGAELKRQRNLADKKLDKLNQQLANAMKEPECTELLTAHFCSAVPLPLQP
jgi:uncharacterized protein YaiL (DUF2058 family)